MENSLKNKHPSPLFFHGQQSNMDQRWQNIGLLLMPSRFEGMPMAALEAMARGIPVLAFAVGGLPTLIEHGRNGWLVPAGNTEAFAAYIRTWQSLTSAQRQAMGHAARRTVDMNFSREAVIPQYLNLYQSAQKPQQAGAEL
jgi:hypothetical protein